MQNYVFVLLPLLKFNCMIPIYKFEQRFWNSIGEQVLGQVKLRFYKQKNHRPFGDDDSNEVSHSPGYCSPQIFQLMYFLKI